MISRKKIILKSEDLTKESRKSDEAAKDSPEDFFKEDDFQDENTWFSLDQLLSDQINEIINKWSQIDDEIWGKVVCFERNRRIAKVYARSQVLSISGSDCDFDGSRIGLNAFPNFRRDSDTEHTKKQIKSGFKLKIDEIGNIYIKRVGKCAIYISTGEDVIGSQNSANDCRPFSSSNHNAKSQPASKVTPSDTVKSKHSPTAKPFRSLEQNKPEVIFNMRKFLTSITEYTNRNPSQMRYPSVDFLEKFHQKCVHCIQLVRCEDGSSRRMLRHPCWIVLVNIVGLDLLWSRFGYSNMILLNQHQLISLRSSFATGAASTAAPTGDANSKNKSRNGDDDKCGSNRKNSDDLYYSGYMAKISSQQSRTAIANNNNNNLINNGAARSATTALNGPAINQTNTPLSHRTNRISTTSTNGALSSSSASSCSNSNNSHHHSKQLSGFTQIPSLISSGRYMRQNLIQSPHFVDHYKRMSRSSNHLNFASTGCSTATTNTSTSEEGGSTSSMDDLPSSIYHVNPRHQRHHHTHQHSHGAVRHPIANAHSKLYKPRYCDKHCHCKPSPSSCGQSHYVPRHAPTTPSHHRQRLYSKNSDRLLAMKKLSSSNIELSSGTFYDADSEMQKKGAKEEGEGPSMHNDQNGDVSIRSEPKPSYGKVKANQKVNNSD